MSDKDPISWGELSRLLSAIRSEMEKNLLRIEVLKLRQKFDSLAGVTIALVVIVVLLWIELGRAT